MDLKITRHHHHQIIVFFTLTETVRAYD
jgi:hypothetical protein